MDGRLEKFGPRSTALGDLRDAERSASTHDGSDTLEPHGPRKDSNAQLVKLQISPVLYSSPTHNDALSRSNYDSHDEGEMTGGERRASIISPRGSRRESKQLNNSEPSQSEQRDGLKEQIISTPIVDFRGEI